MTQPKSTITMSRGGALRLSVSLLCIASCSNALAQDACEALSDLAIPNVTISTAQTVSGSHAEALDLPLETDMAEFCRVAGSVRPVEGSNIGFEVWMPGDDWNGRLQMFGNGGYGSSMSYASMADQTASGYVTVATDTGHQGGDPDFAIDAPESIDDWGHRAVHESVVAAKEIAGAFYGEAPNYSYFSGCSTGGQQALSEAQRYPDDFDGILAGAPGHNRTHLNAGFLWQFIQNHEAGSDTAQIIPASKLPMIGEAVYSACKAQETLESGGHPDDPFLNDPLSCDFDPADLLCNGEDSATCLTQPQVDALAAMYDGARNPETGERIYFGWPLGSENAGRNPDLPGWSLYWADPANAEAPARSSFWRVWAFDDQQWDWWSFDFAQDMMFVDDQLADRVNAMSADLSAFRDAGGKLIQYHGLADPVVPALDSISYYERVEDALGEDSVRDFHRLFLAPGMEHCGGGDGLNTLALQSALEAWVEESEAPQNIMAVNTSNNASDAPATERALCPYPQHAVYNGSGDRNLAGNFTCETRPRIQYEALGEDYLR